MISLRPRADAVAKTAIAGFTLVELMVVMVVLALLAGLTLTGLSGVRDRSKADKTRSTIRKISEIVLPQYESYLTRRVPQRASSPASVWNAGVTPNRFVPSGTITSSTASVSTNRLWGLRLLMTLEMPDQWSDVAPAATLPSWAITAPVKRYAAIKTSGTAPSTAYEGAECLAMIVLRGGFDPDLVELFRSDELGDFDSDRHPEFLDGWGRPIGFIRWPVGFQSPLQPQNADLNPDPFDPQQRSVAMPFPAGNDRDYGVIPLIYSGGVDAALMPPVTASSGTAPYYYGGYYAASDIYAASGIPSTPSWVSSLAGSTAASILASGSAPSIRTITSGSGTIGPGTAIDPTLFPDRDNARDNITNFDLMKK